MNPKTYTEAELNEMLQDQMLQQTASRNFRDIFDSLDVIKEQIVALSNQVHENAEMRKKESEELRHEIKDDFVTREQFDARFKELDTKIDTNWNKLVLIVSVVSTMTAAFGVAAQFLIKFLQ